MDIVDQLRKGFGSAMGQKAQIQGYHQLCGMAVQEIDRLRAEKAELKAAIEAMRVAGGSAEFQQAFDHTKSIAAKRGA